MPLSALHSDIISATNGRGAMFISGRAITALLLDSFQRAASSLIGGTFPTLHPKVTARLDGFSLDLKNLSIRLDQRPDGRLFALLSHPFSVNLKLLYSDDLTKIFASVAFEVSNVKFLVSNDGPTIRIRLSDPTIVPWISDSPPGSRADAIAASGIEPDELLRVEGAFAYGTGERLIESAIGRPPLLDLHELFPAIEFSEQIDLATVRDSLLVIPEAMSVLQPAGCPNGDAANGITIAPQSPQGSGDTRDWDFHALPPSSVVRRPELADPFTAVHLPLNLLQLRFGNIAPAVTYRERDNGFIGYDVQVSCAVKELLVSIDEQERALRLRLGFNAWGTLIADIDVPCVGRADLATARIELPEGAEVAYVEALLKISVDPSGQLIASTEIVGIELKRARVVLDFVGRYVPGGQAKVAAFIIDGVVGRIMAHNIPPLVSAMIRENLNRNFFVLTRLDGLARYIDRIPSHACFSGDPGNVLLGSSYLG